MTQVADQIKKLLSESEIDVKERIDLLRLNLESERLTTETRMFNCENKFLRRNLAAVLTAIISLAAVFVSFSQIWVAKIQKEKELSVTERQRDTELRSAQSQKEKETILMSEQQNRVWRLEMAKFIAEHRNELFGKDATQKALMRSVVLTSFPADISADFFAKLEVLSTSRREKQALQVIRNQVMPQMDRRNTEVRAGTERYEGDYSNLRALFNSADYSKLQTVFNNVAKNIK